MEDRNWKDAPEDVDYRDWENSCTEKLRVPGGWVIRTICFSKDTVAMVFVADPTWEWRVR